MQLAGKIITATVWTPSFNAMATIVAKYVRLATMVYTAPSSHVASEWKRLSKRLIIPDPVSK